MYHTQAQGDITDEDRMQFEKGWLWETTLSKAFAEKAAIRIGEIECDGITCSPDGVAYNDAGELVVEEYKCTSFSVDKTPADVWKWMCQVKGYCKALNTTKCVFRVLHMMFVPVYKVWEIEFTQGEIDENWAAILAQASTMKNGVANG